MTRSILVVDDDEAIRTSVRDALSSRGTEVQVAPDAAGALKALADAPADLVVTDVRMPGMDGIELLQLLKRRRPDTDVILITAYDDLPTVSAGMREGASEFLVKPLDLHQLRRVVDRVFEDRAARQAPETVPSRADAGRPAATRVPAEPGEELEEGGQLIGHHPRMVEIFKLIGQVAGTRATVVIRGESGTGKELIAAAIHGASPYGAEPFVPVNCTALPSTLLESELFGHVKGSFTDAHRDRQGRFALAGRGTIFLDEIGDTSLDFQAKLLRVLQEHEFYPIGAEAPERTEARVIAATHRDLEDKVERGEFRQDLYFRLRVIEIVVPPLRDRLSDIPALAEHLIRRASGALERPAPVLSAEAAEALRGYEWPGNVRELENCLVRALVLATGDVIRPEHLALGAPTGRASEHRLTTLEEVERDHVAFVLEATGGNKTRAAEILGISRPRLARMIKRWGLEGAAPPQSAESEAELAPEDREDSSPPES